MLESSTLTRIERPEKIASVLAWCAESATIEKAELAREFEYRKGFIEKIAVPEHSKQCQIQNLKDECNGRWLAIGDRAAWFKHDTDLLCILGMLNRKPNDGIAGAATRHIDAAVARMELGNLRQSSPLSVFTNEMGEGMVVGLVYEVLSYYLAQKRDTATQGHTAMYQMASSIALGHPLLTVSELVYVVAKGIKGGWGKIYGGVDIATIGEWLDTYYAAAEKHYEVKASQSKPTATQHLTEWEAKEKSDKEKQKAANQQAEIRARAYALEQKMKGDANARISSPREKKGA